MKASSITPTKIRTLVLEIFLFAVCLFAVLEGMARFFYPQVPAAETPRFWVHEVSDNDRLLYKLSPNTENMTYGVLNKINSLGFRGEEMALEKPEGTQRIVFLGDSAVYGIGLKQEQTLPKQFEDQFKLHGRHVSVLNLGVSGYEAQQYIEFFKEAGIRLRPDIVAVGYSLNDSMFFSGELGFLHDHVQYSRRQYRQEGHKQFYKFVLDHSHFFGWLDATFQLQKKFRHFRTYREKSIWHFIEDRNRAIKDPLASPYQQLKGKILEEGKRLGTSPDSLDKLLGILGIDNDDFYASHWNVSQQSFLELEALAKKQGFKIAVVIFPYMLEADKYALGPAHEFLSREFREMGFEVVDAAPFMISHQGRHPERLVSDASHFTAFGAKLLASFLYEEFEKRKLLQEAKPSRVLD